MPQQDVSFQAADGFSLVATLLTPDDSVTPKASVLIFPATGIKRQFYHRFAQWLADQGYAVLTLDYRGIGDSRHGKSVKEFADGLLAWGSLDMPAAVDWMKAQYPSLPLNIVGNSAGGQMIGLLPNHNKVNKLVAVSCSSGYLWKVRFPLWVVSNTLFRYCMPLLTKTLGYAPMSKFGMGQDLPPQMGKDWARWCSSKGYLGSELGKTIPEHWFDQTQMPIHWLYAADDDIATEHNVHDMARFSPAANNSFECVEPAALGYKSIGHITMFSSKKDKFWPLIERQLLS